MTWSPSKREGTGTQSSSVLPRAWEQRLQIFLARLPRKLSGAVLWVKAVQGSLAGLFISRLWRILEHPSGCCCQGQLCFWAREEVSFRSFFAAATQDSSTSTIPSLQESQLLTQFQLPLSGELLSGGVEQMDQQHLAGLGHSSVLSLFSGSYLVDEGALWSWRLGCCVVFLCQQDSARLYLVVITVILVDAVLFLVNCYFFHLSHSSLLIGEKGKVKNTRRDNSLLFCLYNCFKPRHFPSLKLARVHSLTLV